MSGRGHVDLAVLGRLLVRQKLGMIPVLRMRTAMTNWSEAFASEYASLLRHRDASSERSLALRMEVEELLRQFETTGVTGCGRRAVDLARRGRRKYDELSRSLHLEERLSRLRNEVATKPGRGEVLRGLCERGAELLGQGRLSAADRLLDLVVAELDQGDSDIRGPSERDFSGEGRAQAAEPTTIRRQLEQLHLRAREDRGRLEQLVDRLTPETEAS